MYRICTLFLWQCLLSYSHRWPFSSKWSWSYLKHSKRFSNVGYRWSLFIQRPFNVLNFVIHFLFFSFFMCVFTTVNFSSYTFLLPRFDFSCVSRKNLAGSWMCVSIWLLVSGMLIRKKSDVVATPRFSIERHIGTEHADFRLPLINLCIVPNCWTVPTGFSYDNKIPFQLKIIPAHWDSDHQHYRLIINRPETRGSKCYRGD